MGRSTLGAFEEIVMLTVAVLDDAAYGIAIKENMESRLKKSISVGAMRSALSRLEKKGYLISELGEATRVRGGKRKRYFTLTRAGKKILREVMETRVTLWNEITDVDLDFNF